MGPAVVQRSGSYLYARAYLLFSVLLTIVYLVSGVLMAAAVGRALDNRVVLLGFLGFILASIAGLWISYLALLWFFKWESRQSVEITHSGVRESVSGKEVAFVPWEGIREIELAATLVAGANLRIKGNFSEITISNLDLTLSRAMSIREMHGALTQTGHMLKLFEHLRSRAPHAAVRLNRLARGRLSIDSRSSPGEGTVPSHHAPGPGH